MTPLPDFERCYRAVSGRDRRFDGWFVTAVTSTGIYCRPSCPAMTPRRRNVRFYPSPATAQRAGFRACLRCRPDAAPGSPDWDNRADVTARAMRLIGDGVVDRDGVTGLASRLGYTERHLGRLLVAEIGAGPLTLARAQRAHTARTLIETTDLGFAEIAFAAGFGSVRQFNDTIREIYAAAPNALRTQAHRARGAPDDGADGRGPAGWTSLTLRLPYREPYDTAGVVAFLAARAIPGVEEVVGDTYRRTLRLPHGAGVAEVTFPQEHRGTPYASCALHLADLRDLAPAVARCRRLFDLDADPVAADATLAAEPALAADVHDWPGVRLPRAVSGFEMACRAVVGQQVSVAAARRVLGRLTAAAGEPLGSAGHPQPGLRPDSTLTHLFPTAAALAAEPDETFAMPKARRATLRALATHVDDGSLPLDPDSDRDQTRQALLALPGIGPWSADYIALRALGDPDLFLATDLGVRRGAARLGLPDKPAALARYAHAWRPYRSYAVIRLWRYAAATRVGG